MCCDSASLDGIRFLEFRIETTWPQFQPTSLEENDAIVHVFRGFMFKCYAQENLFCLRSLVLGVDSSSRAHEFKA